MGTGDFAANYEVVEGRYRHRRVDDEKGELAGQRGRRETLSMPGRLCFLPQCERLIARIDLVEGENGGVAPVDYKRGAVPDNPERSWEADRVQLCAQGLVLRDNGYVCESGTLYYSESKTRVPVQFDVGLVDRTRLAVSGLLTTAKEGIIPPPLEDSPKCVRCSLAGICLPDETNALAGRTELGEDGIRRILPVRDDALPLYVQTQGARIAKSGEVFEVFVKKEKIAESRIFETSHVALFGNVQVSTQALQEMCSRGIPVTLFSTGGWYYGTAQGMMHENVELRVAQYAAASDASKCLSLARGMIAAKIENCRTMLMRNHDDLPKETPVAMKRLAEAARTAKEPNSLLGLEGMAARTYFSSFAGMLKERTGGEMEF